MRWSATAAAGRSLRSPGSEFSERALDSCRHHICRPDARRVHREEEIENQGTISGELPLAAESAVDLRTADEPLISEKVNSEKTGCMRSHDSQHLGGQSQTRCCSDLRSNTVIKGIEVHLSESRFVAEVHVRSESLDGFRRDVGKPQLGCSVAQEVSFVTGGEGEVGHRCRVEAAVGFKAELRARYGVADADGGRCSELVRRLNAGIKTVNRRVASRSDDYEGVREHLQVVPYVRDHHAHVEPIGDAIDR